jgi:hypothetical protein
MARDAGRISATGSSVALDGSGFKPDSWGHQHKPLVVVQDMRCGARPQVYKGIRMLRLGSGTALIVAAAVTAASQQQPPTFKTGIQTVSLFATVTDATGRLVPDLAKEDFEILDSNKPQAVTLFAAW